MFPWTALLFKFNINPTLFFLFALRNYNLNELLKLFEYTMYLSDDDLVNFVG